MKALRTTGIIVSVALAAAALAVLPSVEEEGPQERAGITIGDASDAGGDARAGGVAGGEDPRSADGTDPAAAGADPSADGSAVALPRPAATEQPVRGIHSDTGVGAIEAEPSPEPAPAPAPAPAAPAEQKPSTGGSSSEGSSSGSSSPGGSSSSGGSKPALAKPAPAPPQRPSGVCEWDDGELECDDDDDDDDDDYDDDDDDDVDDDDDDD